MSNRQARVESDQRGGPDMDSAFEALEARFDRLAAREDLGRGKWTARQKRGRLDIGSPEGAGAHETASLPNGVAAEASDSHLSPVVSFGEIKSNARAKSALRKSAQLCAQLSRAVASAVENLPEQEQLEGYAVVEAIARPHSSTILVVIQQVQRESSASPQDVQQILNRRAKDIREAVTSVIARRKSPDLDFLVLPIDARRID